MVVSVTGGEKFRIWKNRNGYVRDDIQQIIQDAISDTGVSYWCMGINNPRLVHRKRIYEWSRAIALQGKFRLIISSNDWRVKTSIHVYCGEALRLWRERKDISTREFAKMVGCSHTLIATIENGISPSDKTAFSIEMATDGFIKTEYWKEEEKDIDII